MAEGDKLRRFPGLLLLIILVLSSIPVAASRVLSDSCAGIRQVGFNKSEPFNPGDSIKFGASILNNCSSPQSIDVKCYIDNQLWDSGSIPLTGGGSTTVWADYSWMATTGSHTLTFTADASSLSRNFNVGSGGSPASGCSVKTDKVTYYVGDLITVHVSPTPAIGVGYWLVVRDPAGNESRTDLTIGQDTVTFTASLPTGTYEVELWDRVVYPNASPELCSQCTFEVQNGQPKPPATCRVWTDKSTYFIGDPITIGVSPTPTRSGESWLIIYDPNYNQSEIDLRPGQDKVIINAAPPIGTYEIDLYNTGIYPTPYGESPAEKQGVRLCSSLQLAHGGYCASTSCTVQNEEPHIGRITVQSNMPCSSFTLNGPNVYRVDHTTLESITDAPVGSYTINWDSIFDYTTPATETKILTEGGTISFEGDYQLMPSLGDPFNYQGEYVLDQSKLSPAEKLALPYVEKYSKEQAISPALLMAFIKKESGFTTDEPGDNGLAIGYMQLHWDAAQDAANESNSKIYSKADWPIYGEDGDTNIKYGSVYLKICYQQYRNSTIYCDPLKNAISAYNLGRSHGPDGSNEETYVNPVVKYYENYRNNCIDLRASPPRGPQQLNNSGQSSPVKSSTPAQDLFNIIKNIFGFK